MTLAGSQNWDVNWVITPGATDNQVNVAMTFATSNWKTIAGCSGTGAIPEVSPMFLSGNISATTLTLKNAGVPVGTFTFTTDNMLQGDFDYKWCSVKGAYCQREYTGIRPANAKTITDHIAVRQHVVAELLRVAQTSAVAQHDPGVRAQRLATDQRALKR